MDYKDKIGRYIGLVALVIAIVALFTPTGRGAVQSAAHALGGITNYDSITITPTTYSEGLKVGTSSPSTVNNFIKGTCTIQSTANTIAASSTVNASCQAATTGALTALSGIVNGDLIFLQQPTTTPTTFGGLVFVASASSTAGFIHMKIINNTGDTFTWTSTASSSIPYIAIR